MGNGPPPALITDLERIRAYAEGMQLVDLDGADPALRRALADSLVEHGPAVIARGMPGVGQTLGIPADEWHRIEVDQVAALQRWAAHIADPSDISTFEYLRRHTRRGFIAQLAALGAPTLGITRLRRAKRVASRVHAVVGQRCFFIYTPFSTIAVLSRKSYHPF